MSDNNVAKAAEKTGDATAPMIYVGGHMDGWMAEVGQAAVPTLESQFRARGNSFKEIQYASYLPVEIERTVDGVTECRHFLVAQGMAANEAAQQVNSEPEKYWR